jgi:hypothetical protein
MNVLSTAGPKKTLAQSIWQVDKFLTRQKGNLWPLRSRFSELKAAQECQKTPESFE